MSTEQDEVKPEITERERVNLQLRDPGLSALLGWLWPGAGHIYQKRYGKGFLFMACILSTYFYGLGIGGGKVVYASWRPNDYRWQYVCQLGVGLPAMPAIVQNMQARKGKPFFVHRGHIINARTGEIMEPDVDLTKLDDKTPEGQAALSRLKDSGLALAKDAYMAPPAGPINIDKMDVLGLWNQELQHLFELGTLFTVVAGLLNLLAVYDAFAGPAFPEDLAKPKDKKEKK